MASPLTSVPLKPLPQLTKFDNDNASSILGDQWNTVLQAGDTYFADLRAFPARQGMVVMASGISSLNDGGQGFFEYRIGSATDDNINVLVLQPQFFPPSYWARVFIGSNSIVPPIIAWEVLGGTPPTSSEVIAAFSFPIAATIGVNFPGAQGNIITTNPAATFVANARKNGVNFGTMTISTSGVFTFANALPVTFAKDDSISFVAPATPDATLANFCWSIEFTPI